MWLSVARTVWLYSLSLCLGLFPAFIPEGVAQDPVSEEDPLAQTILERADEVRFPRTGFQADIEITSHSSGREPERRVYRVLSKGNENTIVMILEPASERGQMLLMKGRDLWLFLPEVAQPIRIGLAQRLTGQVAYGDIARANFSGDYTPRLLRSESIEGVDYHVLELRAVDRSVTYHRVLLWVNKQNFRPFKAEFYSLSNRLMKTCSYENYRLMLGQPRPSRLVMEDALKKGEYSVLDYKDIKPRDLPDRVFTKEYLKKL